MNTQLSTPSPPNTALPSKTRLIMPSMEKTPYFKTIKQLHKLGWSITAIARELNFGSQTKTRMLIKGIIGFTPRLSLIDLFPHLPFDLFVDDETLSSEFRAAIHDRLFKPINTKKALSIYDVHMLKILVMLGWQKKRIAENFHVSAVLISVYTSDLTPWTADEVMMIFPSLFDGMPLLSEVPK